MPIGDFFIAVGDSINRLFATPMNAWEWTQWLLFAILLSLFLWCCGCLACRGRRHYRRRDSGGYYGRDGYYRSYRIMPEEHKQRNESVPYSSNQHVSV